LTPVFTLRQPKLGQAIPRSSPNPWVCILQPKLKTSDHQSKSIEAQMTWAVQVKRKKNAGWENKRVSKNSNDLNQKEKKYLINLAIIRTL